MSKYIYPAVCVKEEGGYSVEFPDLEGCYTCGKDLQDAMSMAQDVLSLTLVDYEDTKKKIPSPSDAKALELEENEFYSYVPCDTDKYRRLLNNTAVKKTLSIPQWLNESAMAAGLNFSQVLQEALKEKIGLA